MLDRLFVYGTLLAPELRHALAGRTLEGVPATLPGYACYRVRRAPYPAITASADTATEGEVITGMSAEDFENFDAFESALYERLVVAVTDERGARIDAWTYVIDNAARDRLSDEPWDYAAFRLKHLHRYLKLM